VDLRRKVRRTGFTMVEILMVIVLIGLVVTFGLPKLNFSAYRVNSATRSMVSLLARAERLSVTEQYNVNVLFDVAKNQIKIHQDANNDNVIQPTERVVTYPLGEGVVYGLAGAPYRQYARVPVSFERELNGMPEIVFRRDGSASENGGFYITTAAAVSAGRTQDARSIEVTRATGRAQWYQYNGSQWVQKF
jgi:prepilin-type N-terminal cleavage/methylation domain-containing protein